MGQWDELLAVLAAVALKSKARENPTANKVSMQEI